MSKSWSQKRLPDDHPELETKVYLGCGPVYYQRENYINVDIQEYDGCIVHDFTKGLDFLDDNSVDMFRTKLSMEFMPRDDIAFVLKEMYRKLKPGGFYEFIGYDMEAFCRQLVTGKFKDNHEYFLRSFYGRQNVDKDGNKVEGTFRYTIYSYQTLSYLLAKCGFVRIEKTVDPVGSTTRNQMTVVGYKPLDEDDGPVFTTVQGLPEDMIQLKRKFRYHKGIK